MHQLSLFPRRKLLIAGGLTATSLAVTPAIAQQPKWPAKPIRIIVAFPPGGLTDAYARLYAEQNPVNMGSYAPGAYPNMVADQTNRSEDTKIQTINYRGEAPMWVDLAGGQLQAAIGSYQSFATVQRSCARLSPLPTNSRT